MSLSSFSASFVSLRLEVRKALFLFHSMVPFICLENGAFALTVWSKIFEISWKDHLWSWSLSAGHVRVAIYREELPSKQQETKEGGIGNSKTPADSRSR